MTIGVPDWTIVPARFVCPLELVEVHPHKPGEYTRVAILDSEQALLEYCRENKCAPPYMTGRAKKMDGTGLTLGPSPETRAPCLPDQKRE
jgi:hypothetical protein